MLIVVSVIDPASMVRPRHGLAIDARGAKRVTWTGVGLVTVDRVSTADQAVVKLKDLRDTRER